MELRGGVLVLWLGLAVLAQICVAIFGVFSRSLQTKADPPIPALRLLFLVSLLAVAFLALIDALSCAVAAAERWRQQRRAALSPPGKRLRAKAADVEAGDAAGLADAPGLDKGAASAGGDATKLGAAAHKGAAVCCGRRGQMCHWSGASPAGCAAWSRGTQPPTAGSPPCPLPSAWR